MADTGGGGNVECFGSIAIQGTIQRKRTVVCMAHGKVGATAGWTTNVNKGSAQCPASQTGSTFVIPITGLGTGDIITGFTVLGQLESAGGTATLDADFRKLTAAAADLTDASIGTITQISKTADYLIHDSKTFTTPELVSTSTTIGTGYYVLFTATTAALTDIDLIGVQVNLERV